MGDLIEMDPMETYSLELDLMFQFWPTISEVMYVGEGMFFGTLTMEVRGIPEGFTETDI